jgi:D-alanine-D-alanine ligase-like ATP-grasp enzyme
MEQSSEKALPYCPDCGPATVPHWVERWGVRFDAVTYYLTKPSELIWRGIKPAVAALKPGRLAPALASGFASVKMATIVTQPDDKLNWRSRVLWEEAARRGITMKEFRLFGLPRELFFATYRGDTIAFDGLPRPRAARETSLNWMDDKGIIIEKFRSAGIPMPRGKSCRTEEQAEKVFTSMNGGVDSPVIVKPNLGSRSRHTYVHITDVAELRRAFKKAKELSPYVVVEEELQGFVFRITLVNGQVAGVMRREPPHVVGDGKNTIQELIQIENRNPLRHGPIFHELMMNDETLAELKKQNTTLNSVLKKGVMVTLHEKVSRAYGASTTEIATKDIHPDNLALFKKIAQVLDDPLVGVDFMIKDMAQSWRSPSTNSEAELVLGRQKCGVIECNSLPFIDLHHFPLKGEPRNTAGAVWEMVFPGSGSGL